MFKLALVSIVCAGVVGVLYESAAIVLPWLTYRAAARDYPYVAQVSGSVLLDDTGNPLRFRNAADAENYAVGYRCVEPASAHCRAEPQPQP